MTPNGVTIILPFNEIGCLLKATQRIRKVSHKPLPSLRAICNLNYCAIEFHHSPLILCVHVLAHVSNRRHLSTARITEQT
ncbi:CLUMA_CG011008, isoform A [Clunio marinus]|uniref:CLUMA_CG011008, isoform A n=1 Tax=Clunio marinus TaxID=568069 RepID=A0A1J1IF47_9DIPT|nr:CLUMA_CG011008, isoform A [Clunio marinus]